MSLFFRVFQHLLPTGQAWRTTTDKQLRQFFEGLSGFGQDVKDFADAVWLDIFPDTTRELEQWQKQFGLEPTSDEAADRLTLAAAWQAQGGQSKKYIQDVLHAAGFPNVYLHESWSSGPPYVFRDPRSYTIAPLIGTFQCTGDAYRFTHQPECTGNDNQGFPLLNQPECNNFIANDPGYLVNKDLTPRPPPPIPSDSKYWPFFIYVGAQTFPNRVTVSAAQRKRLERLLLQLRPLQHWIVMLVDYGGIFDNTFSVEFQ